MRTDDIPKKANFALNLILIGLFLIALKIWYLTIFAHDDYVKSAKIPQRKTIIEYPNRGSIRDRDNLALAINKVDYSACICYSEIRKIPRVSWKKRGRKKIKLYPRRDYIEKLSKMLSGLLSLDAQKIEDIIHSKACLFPNTPFILKSSIDERKFFQLKALEKDWPGVATMTSPLRVYPQGKLACDLLGYLGYISSAKYMEISHEIQQLQTYIKQRDEENLPFLPKGFQSWGQVHQRLKELKEKSYTINAMVGKSGIEKSYDEQLRGKCGKTKYEIDVQGRFIRKLPDSSDASPGRRLLLSISLPMQKFAEELLAASELRREKRFRHAGKSHSSVAPPWIKGASIIAMVPNTGEIVCMASYPRFDPNDFAQNNTSNILKWLESETYISQLWQGLMPLEREFYETNKGYYLEKIVLDYEFYLNHVLSHGSKVRKALKSLKNLQEAIYILNSFEALMDILQCDSASHLINTLYYDSPHKLSKNSNNKKVVEEIKQTLNPYLQMIEDNEDKLLFLDILRIFVPHHLMSDVLIDKCSQYSIHLYFKMTQKVLRCEHLLKKHVRKTFHDLDFTKWREQHFKEYLKEKRKEEEEKKTYQRPFLDYLNKKEKELFEAFFKKNKTRLLADLLQIGVDNPYLKNFPLKGIEEIKKLFSQFSKEEIFDFLQSVRGFYDLDRTLYGSYYGLPKNAIERDLAKAFYPSYGFGYLKSHNFQERTPLGSIFKIVTAYEALRQHYEKHQQEPDFDINPLLIYDEMQHANINNKGQILGYTLDKKPITRLYKGGRMPKSHKSYGKINMLDAFEGSSNVYFSILASDVLQTPKQLKECAQAFSFGAKTGIDIPGEVRGYIPDDLMDNKTGLYSLAIGQHSLVVTPMQTAIMLSSIANKGDVYRPQLVSKIASLEPQYANNKLFQAKNFAFQQDLEKVDIFFPLFTAAASKDAKPFIKHMHPLSIRKIFMNDKIQEYLLKGLHLVVNGKKGSARFGAIHTLYEHPQMKKDYKDIAPYLVGKTSTAEFVYRPCIDKEYDPIICKHIWFGGISFKNQQLKNPELVVVVYLRYGDYGKEAAPIAASLIKKWRQLQSDQAMTNETLSGF